MTRQELFDQIKTKNSFLCVGLDTDLDKIPNHLRKEADPIFEFNKQIIDQTADFAVAYKPNIAFYEALGPKGWESLQKTLDYIPKDIFSIAIIAQKHQLIEKIFIPIFPRLKNTPCE